MRKAEKQQTRNNGEEQMHYSAQEQMQRTAEQMRAGMELPMPMVSNAQNAMLAYLHLQAQALKSVLRYQTEALGFLKHRYEEDMKLFDQLVTTRDLNDALSIYSSFAQTAASEYSVEASKMADIGSEMASEAARQMRKETESVTDDMMAATQGTD